jgi:hypothetical protein
VLATQSSPVHARSDDPISLPGTHRPALAHQPQPTRSAHVTHAFAASHVWTCPGSPASLWPGHVIGSHIHDEEGHPPALGPSIVPATHCELAAHQPHVVLDVHVTQSVEPTHGGGLRSASSCASVASFTLASSSGRLTSHAANASAVIVTAAARNDRFTAPDPPC